MSSAEAKPSLGGGATTSGAPDRKDLQSENRGDAIGFKRVLAHTQTGDSGVRHTDALSKYHILRRLGSGGMAEIYLARSLGIEGFEKYVVLKKILPEHSNNPAFVRMFLDEARLAAKLQHQNIAQVYDIGRISGGYFFVMEYLHGRDLRSIKREHRKRASRIPIHHALTIAAGAAAGLDYAHNATDKRGRRLGLVHRDISPSNIVATFDGAVKLVDFGIARAGDTPSETRSGALKGKVPYMSPEQCRGTDLDGRSDLFSLGVTLYELCTGVSPFCTKGDTDYTVLEKICAGTYVRPSELVAALPPALEAIIVRALETDREKRYQSAREMLRDVETAAAELGVPLSATALADHLRTIYGEQPVPWADDMLGGIALPTAAGDDEDDELLLKTIATGSVVEGVTLYQITPNTPNTPNAPNTPGSALGFNSRTSVRPNRPMLWLGVAGVVAAAGIVLAISALSKSDGPPPEAAKAAPAAAAAAVLDQPEKPVEVLRATDVTDTDATDATGGATSAGDAEAIAAEAAQPEVPADPPEAAPAAKKPEKSKRRRRNSRSKRNKRKPPKTAPKKAVEIRDPPPKKDPPKGGGLIDRKW